MLLNEAVYNLFHASESKGKRFGGYMKSTGDRSARWEEARQVGRTSGTGYKVK